MSELVLTADEWGAETADAEIDPNDIPRPMGWRALLRPRPPKSEHEVKGGGKIILPDQVKDAQTYNTSVCEVIALGPKAFRNPDEGYHSYLYPGPECEVGDYVLIDKHAGVRVEYKGVRYLLVNVNVILGKVDDIEGVKGYL